MRGFDSKFLRSWNCSRCRWRIRAVFNSLRKLLNYTVVVTAVRTNATAPAKAAHGRPEDLDAQSSQLKQDNLAALAQGIAHDVNNLLGPVTMRLSNLLQQVQGQPGIQDELQQIFNGLKRARQFTSQVVTACKAKPSQNQPMDVLGVIHDTVKFAGAVSNAQLRVRLGNGLRWLLQIRFHFYRFIPDLG